jgi:putative FmdB family regulatory protein
MPLREYRCRDCGKAEDLLIQGGHPETVVCSACGETADYVFGAASFRFSFKYGWDPGAGQHFDSQRQRDTFLDRKGLEKAPDGAYDQAFGEKVHGN